MPRCVSHHLGHCGTEHIFSTIPYCFLENISSSCIVQDGGPAGASWHIYWRNVLQRSPRPCLSAARSGLQRCETWLCLVRPVVDDVHDAGNLRGSSITIYCQVESQVVFTTFSSVLADHRRHTDAKIFQSVSWTKLLVHLIRFRLQGLNRSA